jgi:hypothetical protein
MTLVNLDSSWDTALGPLAMTLSARLLFAALRLDVPAERCAPARLVVLFPARALLTAAPMGDAAVGAGAMGVSSPRGGALADSMGGGEGLRSMAAAVSGGAREASVGTSVRAA